MEAALGDERGGLIVRLDCGDTILQAEFMRQFREAQAQASLTQEALPISVPKRIFEGEMSAEFMAMALEYTDPDRESISDKLLVCYVTVEIFMMMNQGLRRDREDDACG